MTLPRAEVRAVYDRFGARQDSQSWYEDAALTELTAQGRFDTAQTVLELGCGTGRYAAMLLNAHLPPHATYSGLDLSGTMIDLATERLRPFGARAVVVRADATEPIDAPDGAYDRILSTYLFDILSEAEIRTVLVEARRLLRPDGLLCLASLTHGVGLLPRAVSLAWQAVYRVAPARLGGCRAVRLSDYLDGWTVDHHGIVVRRGMTSEVTVARPCR
ncbi:MAG: class I SAM-dependent methyltransferase [Minwuiales bacterium]|nr:class I SAM-dependent methyltransferase [Minwuiales bacterium]